MEGGTGKKMPISNVKPTRMELLRLKKRIVLARRGLELLKLKRAALVMEFFKLIQRSRNLRSNLEEISKRAYETVKIAEIYHGLTGLENASVMIRKMQGISIKTRNVMGIRIPELGKKSLEGLIDPKYRMIIFSAKIDQVIKDFEKYHETILEIAEVENSVRRLLAEIEKTNRRSNAIENVLIPELERQATYLKMKFDEMERDTFVTLKKIKKNLERRENVENVAY
ncbi:MAG: V-type ATP synthase subunit D [Euryarchaeota archaeon]|jgi:V/A-type H+-transporting ATPase subunit D|nr:V-type ATP synthase subunit D [Thermoplasmata archaeon]MVT36433.1 V-type ATP synthase subunit D [Euryarchaeota archaeon]